MRRSSNRTGIALATALIAIVVIGALIAGTFFATTQEYRVARTSLTAQRALLAAEYGQNQLLNDWQMTWNQSMKTGDTIQRVYSPGTGQSDTVVMTRLRFNMFWVVSTGRTGTTTNDDSRRRTGLLIRLDTPEMPFPGAFSGAKSATATGQFSASGNDTIPSGWTDCPPVGPQKAAIASTTTANVTTTGACSSASCLTGNPKITGDSSVADTTKVLDGWADLVGQANIVIDQVAQATNPLTGMAPSYNADGSCKTTDASNWGDPARAAPAGKCESYFPIIYLKSALTGALGPSTRLTTGTGQGILLVDGNINIAGNFVWVGPIIVRGNVSLAGTGNKTVGGIQALNQGCITAPCNSLSGTSTASYSSCTISKIFAMKAKPALAAKRAWADMF
jgi:hypothetical protein